MSLWNKSCRNSLASIFCLFFIPLAQAGFSDVDIVGLKIGMTQDQATAALATHNKNLVIRLTEHKNPGSESKNDPLVAWRQAAAVSRCITGELCSDQTPDHLVEMYASTKVSGGNSNTKETLTMSFSKPPSKNVVTNISRRAGLGSNGTLKTTVLNALTQKYGAPTNTGWQVLVWNYTDNDNSATPEKCNAEIERSIKANKYWQGIGNTADCGLVLTMEVNADDSGVVHQLRSVLVDYSALRLEKLAKEEYRIQKLKEQEEQNKNKASKSPAPKL